MVPTEVSASMEHSLRRRRLQRLRLLRLLTETMMLPPRSLFAMVQIEENARLELWLRKKLIQQRNQRRPSPTATTSERVFRAKVCKKLSV